MEAEFRVSNYDIESTFRLQLTENSSGSIVSGETGFAHSRSEDQLA